jgi:YbbR domain-containing protein
MSIRFPKILRDLSAVRLILALSLALIAWWYIYTTQYPERTLPPFDVPLQDIVVPDGLEAVSLADKVTSVKVTISGGEQLLQQVSSSQLRPYVDVTGVTQPGEFKLPIRLRPGYLPDGLNVRIEPRTVDVRLERRISQTFKLQVIQQGQVNPEYTVEGGVVATPDEVTVEGRESAVKKVNRAVVAVDLNNLSGPFRTSLPIRLLDSQGQAVTEPSLTTNPIQANVAVNINYKLKTRTLPIKVVTTGEPAPGFIAGIPSYTPVLVTLVSADDAVLNNLQNIETEPIDLTSATSEVSKTVKLKAPANVAPQVTQLQVTIPIVQSQLSRDFTIPLEAINPSSALRYSYNPTLIKVTFSGLVTSFPPDLQQRVRAIVNVQGYDAGTYDLPVQIEAPQGLVASNVPPVRVVITRPPPPTPTPTLPPRPTVTPTPTLPPPTSTPSPTPSPGATSPPPSSSPTVGSSPAAAPVPTTTAPANSATTVSAGVPVTTSAAVTTTAPAVGGEKNVAPPSPNPTEQAGSIKTPSPAAPAPTPKSTTPSVTTPVPVPAKPSLALPKLPFLLF